MEHALLSKEMWTLNLTVTVILEKLFFFFFPCSKVLAQQSGVYAELLFSRVTGGVFKVLSLFSF